MREETNGHTKTDSRIAWNHLLDRDQRDVIEQRAREMNKQAQAFIRENPAGVVLAAVAVGFLFGRLVRS